VLQTCTGPVAGAASAQAGILFNIVDATVVADAALRNPLRELAAISSLLKRTFLRRPDYSAAVGQRGAGENGYSSGAKAPSIFGVFGSQG
jgi:hypothetical protein